jgi:hypothetical protein
MNYMLEGKSWGSGDGRAGAQGSAWGVVLASCSGTVEVYITCREKLGNCCKAHKLRFCKCIAPFNTQWNRSTSEIPQLRMIRSWNWNWTSLRLVIRVKSVFCSTLSALQNCRFRSHSLTFKVFSVQGLVGSTCKVWGLGFGFWDVSLDWARDLGHGPKKCSVSTPSPNSSCQLQVNQHVKPFLW